MPQAPQPVGEQDSGRICGAEACRKPLTFDEFIRGFCSACGRYVTHK